MIQTKTTSSNSKAIDKLPPRIDRLFLRFAAIYGHLWKGLYRDKSFIAFAKKEWASTLRDYSDKILFSAVDRCRCQYELPPTLPQFVQLCQLFKPNNYQQPSRQDISVKSDPAVAKKHLQEIAEILNKKSYGKYKSRGEL